ncbi:MAG: hypothetical protein ACTSXV_02180 [Alphaproteobacteria bacterium]
MKNKITNLLIAMTLIISSCGESKQDIAITKNIIEIKNQIISSKDNIEIYQETIQNLNDELWECEREIEDLNLIGQNIDQVRTNAIKSRIEEILSEKRYLKYNKNKNENAIKTYNTRIKKFEDYQR